MGNDLKVEALGGQPPNEKASPFLPRSLSHKPFPAARKKDRAESSARLAVQRTAAERSLRTPAEPCPWRWKVESANRTFLNVRDIESGQTLRQLLEKSIIWR